MKRKLKEKAMKRILLCCTDLMLKQFMIPHVKYLCDKGCEVDIACSDVGGKVNEIRDKLGGYVRRINIIRLVRSPLSLSNIQGYRDLKRIINNAHYDVIWTNEPVMGIVTRLAAQKARIHGTKVIYMVHGFHFYKGAPIQNWLIYYPIEKACSRLCDMIIAINEEDYQRAQSFRTCRVRKVSGVGVNLEDFSPSTKVRAEYREKFILSDRDIMILNVAELTKRKNQHVILEAMHYLNNPHIQLFICGKGNKEGYLKELAEKLGLQEQVHFLGYRNDISRIYCAADIFVLTSKHEGLPKAIMEAMASGLPVVCSDIRGNTDLIRNGKGGYTVRNDAVSVAGAIKRIIRGDSLNEKMGKYNIAEVKKYSEEKAQKAIFDILQSFV